MKCTIVSDIYDYVHIADVIEAIICYLITVYLFLKKTTLQEPPLDKSGTFLSLVIPGVLNFTRKDQFCLMTEWNCLCQQNIINPIWTGWQHSPDFIRGLNLSPLKKPHLNNLLADFSTVAKYTNTSLRIALVY